MSSSSSSTTSASSLMGGKKSGSQSSSYEFTDIRLSPAALQTLNTFNTNAGPLPSGVRGRLHSFGSNTSVKPGTIATSGRSSGEKQTEDKNSNVRGRINPPPSLTAAAQNGLNAGTITVTTSVTTTSPSGTGCSSPSATSALDVSVGDYHTQKLLGEGQFGAVYLASHRQTGASVAVKMIPKQKLTQETLRMVKNEAAVMKLLWHPNVVHFYEQIETPEYLCFAMEYVPHGNLMDLVTRCKRFSEDVAKRFFRQTVRAVAYIHSRNIVHRDIKAENVLLDDSMNIKLIDFGLSTTYSSGELLKTFCGSPTYASPELVQRKGYVGPEVDCWSLGVLLYYLVVGSLPFSGRTFVDLYRKIVFARFRIPPFVSDECADLLRRILTPNSQTRASTTDILNHSWCAQKPHHHHHRHHQKESRGIVVSEDLAVNPASSGPSIDASVLSQLTTIGFNKNDVTQALISHQFNSTTAAYFIMCDQMQKKSSSELSSPPTAPPELMKTLTEDDRTDDSDDGTRISGQAPGTRKSLRHHHHAESPPVSTSAGTQTPGKSTMVKSNSGGKIAHGQEELMRCGEWSSSGSDSSQNSSSGIPTFTLPQPMSSANGGRKQQYGSGGLTSLDSAQTNAGLRSMQQQLRASRQQPQPQQPQLQQQQGFQSFQQQQTISPFSAYSNTQIVSPGSSSTPSENLYSAGQTIYDGSGFNRSGKNSSAVPALQLEQSILRTSQQSSLPSSPVIAGEKDYAASLIGGTGLYRPTCIHYTIGAQLVSNLLPAQIMHAIIDTISDADRGQFECTADSVSPFLVHCNDPRNNVLFDIEVFHVPTEHTNCIKMRRVSGSAWKYVGTIGLITRLLQRTLEL